MVSLSTLRPFGPFPVNTMLRAGDWDQFKKQLAAALLCAVYSFVVAFALMKGLMVVMDVVPDVEMVRSGLVRARRPALVSISQ